jgi:O-antigen ligase/tetratricopeptide (TPR) repeat protein
VRVPERVIAASLGVSFAVIPLLPALIALTGAPIPGLVVLPKAAVVALLALAGVLCATWIVALLSSPRARIPALAAVAALPAAELLATLLGVAPRESLFFALAAAGGVVWFAAVARFARSERAMESTLGAYLASGAAAALVAVAMVVAKTPSMLYTIGHGRATGTFVLPGELAAYLIVYVPVAAAVARSSPRLRAVAVAGLAVAALAFVATFSRGGFVGMAAAIAALVVLRRRRRGARYAVAILAASAVAVALIFNAHHDPSENFTRIAIWETALNVIARFPLTGAGPLGFAHLYPELRLPGGEPLAYHAHSIVLTVAAESGLVGVAALLAGWYRFAVALRRGFVAEAPSARITIAIAAGLIGTWVQGLIDTSTVVLLALWFPFMGLAIASVRPADAPAGTERPRTPRRRALVAAFGTVAALVLTAGGVVQVASDSEYAYAASPDSFPARLPPRLGTRVYEGIERIAAFPLVEDVLTRDALRRGDLRAASAHAARLPEGPVRSDDLARIAAADGRTADAIRLYLDAGDDRALQPFVDVLVRDGRLRAAYALELRIRDRIDGMGMRPNAVADTCWRLARLALQLGDVAAASRFYAEASALAPLNTKYLVEAGTLALDRDMPQAADALFARAAAVDPADADAIAGEGLAALLRRDRADAARRLAEANAINPRATLARRLAAQAAAAILWK